MTVRDGAPYELLDGLIGLDEGTLTEEQEIVLFQELVDTGLAWTLQGRIGRQAADMLADGTIEPPPTGE